MKELNEVIGDMLKERTATATPLPTPARPESVTLVMDRDTARFLTALQTARNAKRREGQAYAEVQWGSERVLITFLSD